MYDSITILNGKGLNMILHMQIAHIAYRKAMWRLYILSFSASSFSLSPDPSIKTILFLSFSISQISLPLNFLLSLQVIYPHPQVINVSAQYSRHYSLKVTLWQLVAPTTTGRWGQGVGYGLSQRWAKIVYRIYNYDNGYFIRRKLASQWLIFVASNCTRPRSLLHLNFH